MILHGCVMGDPVFININNVTYAIREKYRYNGEDYNATKIVFTGNKYSVYVREKPEDIPGVIAGCQVKKGKKK